MSGAQPRMSLSPQGKKRLLKLPKEARMSVLVYHKPNKTEPKIKKIATEIQAVWADGANVHISPCELWAFPNDSIPPGLEDNEHASNGQVWAYLPGTDPNNRDPEQMVFYNPTSKLPKNFKRNGIWTFPLVQRDTSHLKDFETTFLDVGKTVAQEKMDVSGTWKLLYKNDGSDKPIGPGMKSKKPKEVPIKVDPPKTMKIIVRTPEGKHIPLDVKPSDTIDNVKSLVKKKEKIPKDEQRLINDGKELADHPTLEDYHIKDGDILDLDPMQIFVKQVDGTTFPLIVKPTEDINSIKNKIEKQKGIPQFMQKLRFKDEPLSDDDKTLRDYGIKHKSTIVLDPMQIYVKTPDGQTIPVDVDPNDRIKDVKKKIKDLTNIPVPDQTLRFNGDELKDKPTLDDYNIVPGDTLTLDPMQIIVKHWDGATMTLDVQSNDTVDSIKSRIKKLKGMPKEEQRLTFEGQPVDKDDNTLKDYNIKHKSVLHLEPMQIKVKTPDGKTLHFDVNPTDTIEDVKKMVEDEIGMPVPDQTLLFDGEELDDEPTLDDCDIGHGDTLFLDPMQITVKHWDGSTIKLEVQPDDTIDDVKSRVEEEKDIPKKQQHLTYEGKPLKKDAKTLRQYKIPNKAVLHLEPMKIKVQTWDGHIIPLVVDPNDTIEDVKKQVEDKAGIPVPDQNLRFDDVDLDDEPTLNDYNIVSGDTLNLVKGPMEINVKTPDGETIPLEVEPSDTIEDVKKKVEDIAGIPVPDQTLRFKGDELDDEPTLDDYNIVHGDTLNLDPMEITVKHWDGSSVTLQVKPDDTIDDVKSKVEEAKDIPKEHQRLTFGDKPLKKDSKTLRQYKIPNKGVLHLVPMQIKVETPNGEVIPIAVEPSDTIEDVKEKVEDKTGIPVPDQKLTFNGEKLDDDPTLDDYNISNGDTLKLEPMKIFVKKLDGSKIELVVSPTETIAGVKDMVEDNSGIPAEDQNLVFKEKQLEDGPTLKDYDVHDGDTLELTPMEIIVKHWNNSQHTFVVKPTFTIDDIKNMIVEKKKVPKEAQELNFGEVPLDNDDNTLRDYNIKHMDVIQMIKPPTGSPEPKRKSYLPENWREEMETKYGHIKTTTYRTNYSGENDDNFLQGKIREEESDFVFSEKKKKVLESKGKTIYEDP